jgi:hypothetical protein
MNKRPMGEMVLTGEPMREQLPELDEAFRLVIEAFPKMNRPEDRDWRIRAHQWLGTVRPA